MGAGGGWCGESGKEPGIMSTVAPTPIALKTLSTSSRLHADTAETGRMSDISFFGRTMDINAPRECMPVLRFKPFEPDDSSHDRVAARGIRSQDFAGSPPAFKDCAERRAGADHFRHFQLLRAGLRDCRVDLPTRTSRSRSGSAQEAFLCDREPSFDPPH